MSRLQGRFVVIEDNYTLTPQVVVKACETPKLEFAESREGLVAEGFELLRNVSFFRQVSEPSVGGFIFLLLLPPPRTRGAICISWKIQNGS